MNAGKVFAHYFPALSGTHLHRLTYIFRRSTHRLFLCVLCIFAPFCVEIF